MDRRWPLNNQVHFLLELSRLERAQRHVTVCLVGVSRRITRIFVTVDMDPELHEQYTLLQDGIEQAIDDVVVWSGRAEEARGVRVHRGVLLIAEEELAAFFQAFEEALLEFWNEYGHFVNLFNVLEERRVAAGGPPVE